MLVRDCMTKTPITVRPESDPLAALGLCKSARIRRLPVATAEGKLVGIVSRNDLELFLSKAPSPGIMKRQHRIEQVMVSRVITVSPEHPMEEAARLMVEHKVGSLPVVENGRLVGIITETDIFKQFVDVLGGGVDAIRLTVTLPDAPGQMAHLVNAIAALGGNIRSVVISRCDEPGDCAVTLWLEGVDQPALTKALQNLANIHLIQFWSQPFEGDQNQAA